MSSSVKVLTVDQVVERCENNPELLLLDVRSEEEWEDHHIPGSLHIPMHYIVKRLSEIDAARETIVICEHGVRSQNVASYLVSQANFKNVGTMTGGLSEWKSPMESLA